MTTAARAVQSELASVADPEKAKVMAGYFKTGPGEYGEGDAFLGVSVPAQRQIARKHADIRLTAIAELLRSSVHEERLTALFILVTQYNRGDAAKKEACFDFYLKHLEYVNNWDLVDSSAHQIVGSHILAKDRRLLSRLAKSKRLWDRRVAIVSTYAFICAGESAETFKIAELLLSDPHDLIHKAVGWMLREVGQRVGEAPLRDFLTKNVSLMPRTTLRYAIERLAAPERKTWLAKR